MIKQVLLRKNEERRILNGHLWAFSNEILSTSGPIEAGEIVELARFDGKFVALGFYNPHSLIAVRIITRTKEDISFDFFKGRIAQALALRQRLFPDSQVYRLVHGESDLLPGLIIDRYGDQFVVQTLSFGMDRQLGTICEVVQQLCSPTSIIERNDVAIRALEHLPEKTGVLTGYPTENIIEEHGIKYSISVLEGQKTGLFLDQRENRLRLRRYCNGAEVLDCFCNAGGFGLNAWRGGAASVIGVDISESAVAASKRNAELNGSPNSFICADVFDQLQAFGNEHRQFDVVILDPPSFTKSKKTVATALKGYKHINSLAMSLIRKGGFLVTSSCSHHVDRGEFLDMVSTSALKAERTIQLLEFSEASPDHPVHPSMPETHYLKFAVYSVL